MIASASDAQLLLGRLKDSSHAVQIKLTGSEGMFEAIGTVEDYTLTTLRLAGVAWQFTVPLDGATYVFSDPHEVPIESVRESEVARYEQGLSVELADGSQLTILELKMALAKDEDEA